jgi:hypothetical protein
LLRAELDFVTDLAERIKNGNLGGVNVWRRMHELRSGGMTFEQIMADPVGHLGPEAAIFENPP